MAGEDQNLRLSSDVYTHAHIHTQKIKRTNKETTGFILGEGRGERDGETKNSKDILVQAMLNTLERLLVSINNMGACYSDYSIRLQRENQICINVLENNYVTRKYNFIWQTPLLYHL